MPKLRPSLAASAVALSCAAAPAAAQYSGAWAFGDSLGDAGQYGSRFTTNPGLTFPMYLGERYGISLTPSTQGGTNYAYGGARMNSPGVAPPGFTSLSVTQQVSAFLARGPLDPNALYQIQGGANDIRALAVQAATGQITPAQLQAGVAQAAIDLATQAARLQAAGARYLVVYNMPDIGKTPEAAAANAQANLTALSGLFNSTLNGALAAANVQVVQVNSFGLLQEVVANPAAFGFVNVTTPVCTTASSFDCTPATLRDPNGNLTWAFADGIHPTTGLALLGAAAAASMIQAPAQMSSLAFAPLNVYEANFRAIDGRMQSAINERRSQLKKYEMWAAYDFSQNDIDGPFLSGDADLNTIAVGGDIKLSPNLLAGASFGYTENKGDFGGGTGGYKLRETAGNVYVGYGAGPWYVGAVLGGANLDYSTHRNLQLGALSRTESGDTTGWQYWGTLLGGYWFNIPGTWQHGPFGRLTYQEVRVKGFSENGSDSTALSYGEQKRESFLSSIGWQATGKLGMFRPFGRITWEYDFRDNLAEVSATPVGFATTYTVPGIQPDDNYFRYVVGGSADFGSVTAFLNLGGTFSNSNGDSYAITVGVRIPLM